MKAVIWVVGILLALILAYIAYVYKTESEDR